MSVFKNKFCKGINIWYIYGLYWALYVLSEERIFLWKVPSVVIGLTIVAFGTSAPEAAVSIDAALKGSNAIALNNVIGSNVFNLLAVVGICGIINAMPVDRMLLKFDYLVNIAITVIMLGFIFIYAIVATIRDKRDKQNAKSKEAFERLQEKSYKKELESVINFSQNDAFNIAALRKKYFLNFADAKKLWEILKTRK